MFPPAQEEGGTPSPQASPGSEASAWSCARRLTLSPPSAGDPATTLPWGLLRPPPPVRGLHLHLGQVSLVLTHLVGSWGLPGVEDPGRVACRVWCLQGTGAEDVCSEPQEDRPPCP